MADENTNPSEAPQQAVPPQIRPLAQYIRDMSFENVLAQKNQSGNVTPDVSVQVGLDARKRPDHEDQYEVLCKFTIRNRDKETDNTLFLLELEYAGMFQVSNVEENQLHPFLLIEGPRQLFPYVRRLVADITHEGGFPPLNLEPVDFVQLYRQTLMQRAQKEQAAQGTPAN
ncbi:protein-export chaperone SecB [Palleronia caenipelagi]|uniref:Protein-export protein SecB n=1 Tax=Palleronia caenipelagi TaxID=2489174 RepID=A0A547Q8T9_9RHOB|nr:protein-export chaperone SecB [Palleronia caenipelagi]TRD22791.1 protein-export chaperone SecB [Palleronia caenipelagi]